MQSTFSVQVLRGGRKVLAKVDRGAGGVDGAVEVAPPALDTHGGLVDTLIWRARTAPPRPQSVALDPAPEGRAVRLQAASAAQSRAAASRNGSDECLLHDFSKLTPTSTTVATRLKARAFDIFRSLTELVGSGGIFAWAARPIAAL